MSELQFEEIIVALKQKLKEILPQNSRAVLYGSQARGEAGEESDWDIHILVPGQENLSISEMSEYAFPLEQLGWDFNQCFSVAVYSHIGWQKRISLPYFKNVEREKIILLAT